jgi:hypothetical protein
LAHEIRYIAFSRSEVAEMVRAFAAQRGVAVPDGKVVALFSDDAELELVFEDDNERQAVLRFTHTEAVAFILAHCRKRQYPIAQRFTKHVETTDNALILAMRGAAQALTHVGRRR